MPLPKPSRWQAFGSLLLALLATTPAGAAELDQLAERLAKLRGEVESLNDQLQSAKKQHENTMSSLARQKSDLETKQRRREVKLDELRKTLAENRKASEEAGVQAETLKPTVLAAIDQMEQRVEQGLPFKVGARRAELDELRNQIRKGTLSPHRAAKRLWGFYQDEISMGSENGVFQQTIALGDQQKLAEVARVGMTMLFFKTSDGQVGRAVRDSDGWHFRTVSDSRDQERIRKLFTQFKKQIRTGYFVLPNALPAEEVSP
jgi:predicted RNase H-like nuclease (RuvC/YqgF family)